MISVILSVAKNLHGSREILHFVQDDSFVFMKKLLLILPIVIFLAVPCHAKINLNPFSKDKDKDEVKDWEIVQVYETATLDKKFVVVGKLTVQGMHQNNLVEKFKKTAKKHHGDAVLKYRPVSCEKLPQFSTAFIGNLKLPCAEGIIVKLDDEKGISEISMDTPIPVLQ